jgi:PhnB protein
VKHLLQSLRFREEVRTMGLSPYLTFDGRCEAAFRFYEECLGGAILMMLKYEESPMASQVPPDWGNKIVHATFALEDQTLGGADLPPESYRKPQGFSVTLDIESTEEAIRIFEALAAEGSVQVPLQETFWARRFGMLTDRFGVPWMINCGRSD